MRCLSCEEQIEDDSAFCDMCGSAVAKCPTCKIPLTGAFCTTCGAPAASAATPRAATVGQPINAARAAPASPVVSPSPTPLAIAGTRRLSATQLTSNSFPALRLRNRTLGVDVTLADDTTIGRATGPHVALFAPFDQVSSRHCRFHHDSALGWCVTDLGSTNGTHYNNRALSPNVPQGLSTGSYLKLANIEFFVTIGPD